MSVSSMHEIGLTRELIRRRGRVGRGTVEWGVETSLLSRGGINDDKELGKNDNLPISLSSVQYALIVKTVTQVIAIQGNKEG